MTSLLYACGETSQLPRFLRNHCRSQACTEIVDDGRRGSRGTLGFPAHLDLACCWPLPRPRGPGYFLVSTQCLVGLLFPVPMIGAETVVIVLRLGVSHPPTLSFRGPRLEPHIARFSVTFDTLLALLETWGHTGFLLRRIIERIYFWRSACVGHCTSCFLSPPLVLFCEISSPASTLARTLRSDPEHLVSWARPPHSLCLAIIPAVFGSSYPYTTQELSGRSEYPKS